MMQLYWSPKTRSFTALWLLEEAGAPYEKVLADLATGGHKAPDFLKINPMGKVPALRDGEALVAENGAIAAYVADRFPEPNSRRRSAIRAAAAICNGCSSRHPASSRR